ncbi:MAG: 16S rRNA (cytosine(1402)-N(4))-methyltransferase, partial [Deltaproteobacteria bacterium]|nr:16S rRNA (cytosine(1402)-N(4))-methyltransferase [Deltaproteobacteria bacterium]
MSSTGHLPVMAREVAEILAGSSTTGVAEIKQGTPPGGKRIFVDATLGGGGHTPTLRRSGAPDVNVVAIDRDEEAISRAGALLKEYGERIVIVRDNFRNIKEVLDSLGIEGVDGITADIGLSSIQLDDAERGFSFRFEGPLDMRMD